MVSFSYYPVGAFVYDLCRSDFDTAFYLFSGVRYPQGLYYLFQAIEKLLKAIRIENTSDAPEKSYRLEHLTK